MEKSLIFGKVKQKSHLGLGKSNMKISLAGKIRIKFSSAGESQILMTSSASTCLWINLLAQSVECWFSNCFKPQGSWDRDYL